MNEVEPKKKYFLLRTKAYVPCAKGQSVEVEVEVELEMDFKISFKITFAPQESPKWQLISLLTHFFGKLCKIECRYPHKCILP